MDEYRRRRQDLRNLQTPNGDILNQAIFTEFMGNYPEKEQ